MLRNILNKINSLEFRDKIIFFIVISLIGFAVWNCYLMSQSKNNIIEKFTEVTDTRNENFQPSHYQINKGRGSYIELKIARKIGIISNSYFCSLETIVPWHDYSASIIQRVQLKNEIWTRYSTGAKVWSEWKKIIFYDSINQENLIAIKNLINAVSKFNNIYELNKNDDENLNIPFNLIVKGDIKSNNITSTGDITCNGKLKVEGETLMNGNLLLNSLTDTSGTPKKLTKNSFNITTENLIVIGGKNKDGNVYWHTEPSNNTFSLGTKLYIGENEVFCIEQPFELYAKRADVDWAQYKLLSSNRVWISGGYGYSRDAIFFEEDETENKKTLQFKIVTNVS